MSIRVASAKMGGFDLAPTSIAGSSFGYAGDVSARLPAGLALLTLVGCGRIGFDNLGQAQTDGAPDAPCSWTAFSAPVKLAGVNSATDDWDAMPTQNTQALYFHSYRPSPNVAGNIWVSRPVGAAPVEVAEVNSSAQDLVVTLSEDGLVMMFTSDRPGGEGAYDLWQTSRTTPTGTFAPPSPVAELNDAGDQWDPWLTPDGLELWYLSGPTTASLQFKVTRRADRASPFGPSTTMPELDAVGHVSEPTVSPDGLDLWFTSDREGGLGDFDIWTAHRSALGAAFGAPTVVPELSTSKGDSSPRLSRDGSTMYLVYAGPNPLAGDGSADLWTATRTCR